MRCLLLAALLAAPLPIAALAQAQGWVPQGVAELQALDKVTARVSTLRVPVNAPVRFGSLTINVEACYARPPDEVPDSAVYMRITDSRGPSASVPAFQGWMFANAPGVHMLEHPVYDIRVIECRAA
jgi:hypothetical protein